MRTNLGCWPAGWVDWAAGLVASAPLAVVLWLVSDQADSLREPVAMTAVVLGLPWVVPATVLVAVASAPAYMWLHSLGPVPPVLQWLAGCILVAAVIGAHINAAWLIACWRQSKGEPEPGLAEFLSRPRDVPREPPDRVR